MWSFGVLDEFWSVQLIETWDYFCFDISKSTDLRETQKTETKKIETQSQLLDCVQFFLFTI